MISSFTWNANSRSAGALGSSPAQPFARPTWTSADSIKSRRKSRDARGVQPMATVIQDSGRALHSARERSADFPVIDRFLLDCPIDERQ